MTVAVTINGDRRELPAGATVANVIASLHDVPEGRQYNNNETIAFFGETWDVFASH